MKQQTKHARRMKELANKNLSAGPNEGKWQISFWFDGICYKKSHQLSASEIKHMKDLCTQFGDEAAQQVIWRAAIKGVGTVSENVMAQAGLDYVKAHYNGPIAIGGGIKGSKVAYADIVDQVDREDESEETRAKLAAYLEERKPLPDEKAFDPEAAAQVQESIMKDQL